MAIAFIANLLISACSVLPLTSAPEKFHLSPVFPSAAKPSVKFNASIIASSLFDAKHGLPQLIVSVSDGTVAALEAKSGLLLWQRQVPVPQNQQAQLIATPVIIGDKLVVSYQCLEKGERTSHRIAVLDLASRQWDARFPVLTVTASQATLDGKGIVNFNPPTVFSHAALKHWQPKGSQLGYVYAAYGNAGDVQPFHGWLFEIDMDAWQQYGVNQAIKNTLLTTPETNCRTNTEFGTQEMICGGGLWVPSGPLLEASGDEMQLFIPTGNGQIDLARQDYGNSLMRVKPGLKFDAACDTGLCAKFDPFNPDDACLSSCKNLFVPRLSQGNAPLKPPFHECDGKGFLECMAWMDYDLGANTPIKITMPDGRQVLVQAGKDGGAYLVDAEHIGKQYDRLQIAKLCGSPTDLCKLSWAGMIVTQPVQTVVDGDPVVIIPTFSPDKTNVAGVVALKIVLENGQPKLQRFWQFPDANNANALKMFRSHPSFPLLTTTIGNEAIIWLVDIGAPGTLYGIRAKDGSIVAQQALQGSGRQLSMPLLVDGVMYLSSIMPTTGKAMVEAFKVELDKSPSN